MTGILEGRRALVTGAGRGIGAATVERFRAEGAQALGSDVEGADLVCDVTDEASVEAAFDEATARLGGLDVVVANAGILHAAEVADETREGFERILAVNLVGVFLTMRAAARRLERGGAILATASQAGRHGYPGLGAYCASKFGVIGLVEVLAKELAPRGLRVACIAPGLVDTPMQDDLHQGHARVRGTTREAVRERMMADVPVGRLADADEIARVFAFLASDLAAYVSGATIVVDAGECT